MDGRTPDTRPHAAVITGPSLADVWPEVSGRLGRLLASRGASRDLADDVVQEVAARALARAIVFEDAADLMRWAVPVALNLLVDSARHAGRVTVGIEGWDAAEGDVADLVAHRDRLTRVLGAVERLSDADRVALTSAEAPADRREAVKLAAGTWSTPCGKRRSAAAALCAPSRPGYAAAGLMDSRYPPAAAAQAPRCRLAACRSAAARPSSSPEPSRSGSWRPG